MLCLFWHVGGQNCASRLRSWRAHRILQVRSIRFPFPNPRDVCKTSVGIYSTDIRSPPWALTCSFLSPRALEGCTCGQQVSLLSYVVILSLGNLPSGKAGQAKWYQVIWGRFVFNYRERDKRIPWQKAWDETCVDRREERGTKRM